MNMPGRPYLLAATLKNQFSVYSFKYHLKFQKIIKVYSIKLCGYVQWCTGLFIETKQKTESSVLMYCALPAPNFITYFLQGREGILPPHSFQTSFYLFAAVPVPIGIPNFPLPVFWEWSSISKRQFLPKTGLISLFKHGSIYSIIDCTFSFYLLRYLRKTKLGFKQMILKLLFSQVLQIWNIYIYRSKDNYIFFDLSLVEISLFNALLCRKTKSI